jgi:hypothetical protein
LGPIRRTWRRVKRRRWAVGGSIAAILCAVVAFAAARYLSPKPEQPAPPDPYTVVKDYARLLADGQPVTLIGKDGSPKWFRWALGKATLGESYQHLRVCEVQTNQTSLLELLPDPGRDRYRISAEFSVGRAIGGLVETETAVYFGYQELELPDGFQAIRFIQAGIDEFYDELASKKKNQTWRNQTAQVLDRLLCRTPDLNPGVKEYPSKLYKQVKLGSEHSVFWRHLEVDVTPDRVEVRYGEGDNELKLIYAGTPSDFARSTAAKRNQIEEQRPGAGVHLREWSPRMPLGIVVRNASVAVRNVIVEPLNNGTN